MSNSPLDAHLTTLREWLKMGKNNTEIAKLLQDAFDLETSEASVRRCIERNESLQEAASERDARREILNRTEAPGAKHHENGEVEITLPAAEEDVSVAQLKIEKVMERHGLNADEWECYRALPNVWEANAGEGKKIKLYQFKLWFRRLVPLNILFPATDPGYLPKRVVSKPFTNSWLWAGFFDQHCPYYDRGLKQLAMQWLDTNQPREALFGGDGPDYPDASTRHPKKLLYNATPQECVQSWFEYMRDFRLVSPNTIFKMLEGNHDKRIQKLMLERAYDLAGLTPAEWPEELGPMEVMYSPEYLFHLKALDIELIKTPLNYEFGVAQITDGLTARHGTFHGKDALAKHAEKYNHDMVYGHLHRMGFHAETRWDDSTNTKKIVNVIQAPTMAEVNLNGLGYDTAPNWQQGFVTAQIFDSGRYTLEWAFYNEGTLVWRDQEYSL